MEAKVAQRGLSKYRWVLVVVMIGGLILLGHVTGVGEQLESVGRVRAWVLDAGGWGLVLFLALFAVGAVMHAPGILFLVAALLIYPMWPGVLIAFAGSVFAVTVSFVIVRFVGGQPLGEIRRPWLRRILRHLDDRPVRTVFLLRTLLWLHPAVSSVLAMSSVRFRDYLLGSALGLALPITLFAYFFDVIERMGWLRAFL
jgi:uncharacterized membrane protein YdjX (TVP38/TMEM64 family)